MLRFVLLLLAGSWALACPYLLGTWLATQLGLPSAARTPFAWATEAIFLTAAAVLIALLRGADLSRHRPLRTAANAVLATAAALIVVAATLVATT